MVEVAGEQAAAGVGDAECAVYEYFELNIRAFLADFGDFFHAQFARQDNAFHADALPEFHAPVVGGVGLHGEVDGHIGPAFAGNHNQAGVGHNQRVGLHGNQRLHIGHKGFELAVVRQGVDGEVELFAACVGFGNAGLQYVELGEFVVAGTQGIARAAGIHGIGAVIEGGTHTLGAAGGEKEFGRFHGVIPMG